MPLIKLREPIKWFNDVMLGAFGITTYRIRELIKWFNDVSRGAYPGITIFQTRELIKWFNDATSGQLWYTYPRLVVVVRLITARGQ